MATWGATPSPLHQGRPPYHLRPTAQGGQQKKKFQELHVRVPLIVTISSIFLQQTTGGPLAPGQTVARLTRRQWKAYWSSSYSGPSTTGLGAPPGRGVLQPTTSIQREIVTENTRLNNVMSLRKESFQIPTAGQKK